MPEAKGVRSQRNVQLVRVSDEHDAALAEFYRATWSPRATAEAVREARRAEAAANPVSPGTEPPSFVLLQQGKVVGYLGTIPIRIWSNNEEHSAHWVKGLMVLPEFRNGPVGFLVLRETLRHLDCAMALAVLPVVVGMSVRLGFTNLGTLPNFVRVLRPAKMLCRIRLEEIGFARMPKTLRRSVAIAQRLGLMSIAGICIGGLIRLAIVLRGRFPSSLRVDAEIPETVEMDALWERTRSSVAAGLVRDSRYLNWRYPPRSSGTYRFVTVRKGRDLTGLAVVRRPRAEGDPRLHGLAVATVSEWIFPATEPLAGLAALAGAERVARGFGADALLCSIGHRSAVDLLGHRGFFKAPHNVHLLIRDPKNVYSLPADLSEWWITRGDSNADEVF